MGAIWTMVTDLLAAAQHRRDVAEWEAGPERAALRRLQEAQDRAQRDDAELEAAWQMLRWRAEEAGYLAAGGDEGGCQ